MGPFRAPLARTYTQRSSYFAGSHRANYDVYTVSLGGSQSALQLIYFLRGPHPLTRLV